ncbi:predicted protein [Nematostella vectensis]|uniref:B box-type domain-containing protein n=1 Tax=Nematostella vectensis TaxID=45351 RepID=A7SQM3_NEMVE|nr:predicted protein [Nematostella vectensis]|eukprot:XP_001626090.1 predicted protein [Nematostella vectensis]
MAAVIYRDGRSNQGMVATCLEKQLNGCLKCPVCSEHAVNIKSPRDVEDLPCDSLLNSVLDMVALHGGKQIMCDICDDSEQSTAVSRCKQCATYFCSLHGHAHKTSKYSKGHTLMYLDELRKHSLKDLRRPLYCSVHPSELLAVFCESCDKAVCKDCCALDEQIGHAHVRLDVAIDKCNKQIESLLQQAKEFCKAIEETIPTLDTVVAEVNKRTKNVLSEIEVIFEYQVTTLWQRKKELRDQVLGIKKSRSLALKEQQQRLQKSLQLLRHACKFTEINVTTSANHKDGTTLNLKKLLTSRLTELMDQESSHLLPVESSFLRLRCDDALLHKAIETFGKLDMSTACPKQCTARGLGLKAAPVTQPTRFVVILNDCHGQPLGRSEGELEVDIVTDDNRRVNVDVIVDRRDGTYEVSYTPMQRGTVSINVRVMGEAIGGCPFVVPVVGSLRKSWI